MPSASPEDGSRQDGSVTAELAVGALGVALLLAAVLSTAVVGAAAVGVQQAAGAAARALARGDDPSASARALTGGSATVQVEQAADGLVHVVVSRTVQLPLPGSPSVAVRGRAAAYAEGDAAQTTARTAAP